MKADFINPILTASRKIILALLNKDMSLGKLSILKEHKMNETVAIMIWMTGDFKARFLFVFEKKVACNIATTMIGSKINKLDEMAKSALGELASIILGRAGIIYSEKDIDVIISYPTMVEGESVFISHVTEGNKIINIPMILSDGDVIYLRIEDASGCNSISA